MYSDLIEEVCMAAGTLPEGVEMTRETKEEVDVSTVDIVNEKGSKAIGRPVGRYVTITAPEMAGMRPEIDHRCALALADCLEKMRPDSDKPVLIIGLGNRQMTPDSLGPRTVEQVMVTRHLFALWPEELKEAQVVCAFSPGVLGSTGIESGEAVEALVREINPGVVIAVDTLAAGDANRMGTTIQLGNTGIVPGGGIGNRRMVMDEETLGVPVLALGIPLVVRAETLMEDETKELIVTPKDIDRIVQAGARVLSRGLNQALHPKLPQDFKELLAEQS